EQLARSGTRALRRRLTDRRPAASKSHLSSRAGATPQLVPDPPRPAADEVQQRDEERRSDNRPDDGERVSVDGDDEEFGEAQLVSEERPDERSDEAEGDRHEQTATGAAADRAAERAADPGDDQHDDEARDCDGHGNMRVQLAGRRDAG